MIKKGAIYVFIQFACIVFLLIHTSFQLSWGGVVQLIAVVLALWSVYVMQRSRFNIFPNVKKGSILLKSGPYKRIRHPMYTSILLFFLPTLVFNGSITTIVVYLVLLLNLLFKLKYEEQLLSMEFDLYEEYKSQSFHLIPFIY